MLQTGQSKGGQDKSWNMRKETFEMNVSFSSPVKCGIERWAQRVVPAGSGFPGDLVQSTLGGVGCSGMGWEKSVGTEGVNMDIQTVHGVL